MGPLSGLSIVAYLVSLPYRTAAAVHRSGLLSAFNPWPPLAAFSLLIDCCQLTWKLTLLTLVPTLKLGHPKEHQQCWKQLQSTSANAGIVCEQWQQQIDAATTATFDSWHQKPVK